MFLLSLLSHYKKGVRPPVPAPTEEEGAVREVETECCKEVIGNISDEVEEEPDMDDTGARKELPPPFKLPKPITGW